MPSDTTSLSSNVVEQLLSAPQYAVEHATKSALLLKGSHELVAYHRTACEVYRRILEGLGLADAQPSPSLSDLPFLPVRLFKSLKLQSIEDSDLLKTLTSSGTTSQQVSRIAIDRTTAQLQTKALASIITSFIGPKRLPMIIIDSASTLRNRESLNARGAGLVGLSNFGRDHLYALDDDMRLNTQALHTFLEKHQGERVLIFGFTFMVWQYFYHELRRTGVSLPLEQAVLIHSGGWKKLQDQQVDNTTFKASLRQVCGIQHVHNFYGMVEQVGSIYMECEHGYFHAPNVAEVLIRDYRDWSVSPVGTVGLLQTLSVLPRSYPGHSLLTDDLATVYGVDDCPCGRKGTRFTVQGRMQKAELRGCSDTHAFGIGHTEGEAGTIQQFLPTITSSTRIEALCTNTFFLRRPTQTFDPLAIECLDDISSRILKVPGVKKFPELVALAFWLRKSHIRTIVQDFVKTVGPHELTMPLGVVFHVAPSNVDTIFLYSWALALLAGNINVVRISQNGGEQLEVLLGVLEQVFRETRWASIAERNIVLTYPREEHINRFLSEHADARVIWGGDATVSTIRALPAKPRTKDIPFADKVSSTVIDATYYVQAGEEATATLARSFYNDAYQFNQLACSSPHFVLFVGPPGTCAEASHRFWSLLTAEVIRQQRDESMSSVADKLVATYELLAQTPGAHRTWHTGSPAPVVSHVPLEALTTSRDRVAGGFFLECFLDHLTDLAQVVQSGDQTLGYIGFTREQMEIAAKTLCALGIDRIVPVGQALSFGPVWDGYVLLSELTRRVAIT